MHTAFGWENQFWETEDGMSNKYSYFTWNCTAKFIERSVWTCVKLHFLISLRFHHN
jgi:hypothetical protein